VDSLLFDLFNGIVALFLVALTPGKSKRVTIE
jgi:hypothetical protein